MKWGNWSCEAWWPAGLGGDLLFCAGEGQSGVFYTKPSAPAPSRLQPRGPVDRVP